MVKEKYLNFLLSDQQQGYMQGVAFGYLNKMLKAAFKAM